MLRFIITVFCIEALVVFVELGIGSGGVALTNEPLPGLKGCILTANPPMYYLEFWGPIIIYETLLCILVLKAGWTHARAEYQGARLPVGRIVKTLIRDNVFYFFCFLFVCLVNVVMWAELPASWSDMPEGFVPATDIVLGCRLIINTWQSVRGGPQQMGNGIAGDDSTAGAHELGTVSTMQFSDKGHGRNHSSSSGAGGGKGPGRRGRGAHAPRDSLMSVGTFAAGGGKRFSVDSAYTRIEEGTLVEREADRTSFGSAKGKDREMARETGMGMGMELVEEQEEPVYIQPVADDVFPGMSTIVEPRHSPAIPNFSRPLSYGRTSERALPEDSVTSGRRGFSNLAVEEADRHHYPPDPAPPARGMDVGAGVGVRPLPNPGIRPLPTPSPGPGIRPLPDPVLRGKSGDVGRRRLI